MALTDETSGNGMVMPVTPMYGGGNGGFGFGGSYRGYSRDGYSRDDAKADMLNELREMHMDATDEETKQMIKTWMNQLEQR